MTPERELLMDLALREILDDSLDAEDLARLKRARDHAADVLADVEAAPKTGPLKRGLNDNESILAWAVDYLSDVILGMQGVNRALAKPEAPQQAVLDAYTRCAEICKSKMADEIATGDVDHNENAWSFICERAILAARDALKDKP